MLHSKGALMKNYTALVLCCFLIASHTIYSSSDNNCFEFAGYHFNNKTQQNVTQNASTQTNQQNSGTNSPNHLSNIFAVCMEISDNSKDKNEKKVSIQAEIDYEDKFPKVNPRNTGIKSYPYDSNWK
jgi:hypothetical protein